MITALVCPLSNNTEIGACVYVYPVDESCLADRCS